FILEMRLGLKSSIGTIVLYSAPLKSLKMGFSYFCLKNTWIGTPLKLKCSRSLFSINRLYGSLMYWGKLQKNANIGDLALTCVTYFTLMYLPLLAGGG